VIPLPVILCEFIVAFGLALLAANVAAYVRLRREDNWPPTRPAGTPVPTSRSSRAAALRGPLPSRRRITTGAVIGLVMALWAVATFVSEGYSF
jgi:hypothetical protein